MATVRNPTPTRAVVLYLVLTAVVAGLAIEGAARYALGRRLSRSLPVFECILCDGRNVLRVTPDYRGIWETPAFRVTVRTNHQGYREDVDFDDPDVAVAFMGDSFTFGHGVEGEDRYSAVVARAFPDRRVISLSYNNGFQPEHYEFFLDRHPRLRPDRVLIGLYLGNDLDSDIAETTIVRDAEGPIGAIALPARRISNGVQANAGVYRFPWFAALVDHTSVGKMVAIAVNASPRLRQWVATPGGVVPGTMNRASTESGQFDERNLRAFTALSGISRRLASHGGRLDVLLIPRDVWFENPDGRVTTPNPMIDAVTDRCAQAALRCHDLSPLLTRADYLAGDGHWNKSGHAKVGAFAIGVLTTTGEGVR